MIHHTQLQDHTVYREAFISSTPVNIGLKEPLSNTLALTSYPLRIWLNLWYRPIFGTRRLTSCPITHRDILSSSGLGHGYSGPYLSGQHPLLWNNAHVKCGTDNWLEDY